MLATEITHIMTDDEYKETIANNENVMICCGRNGPMCLPVYDIMEDIQEDYKNVTFRVMLFDHPVAQNIKRLSETRGFMGLPFTVYYKNGKVVKATSSIQGKEQVTKIIEKDLLG